MSQFPHDEFAKEYFPEFYQDYGIVTPSADVMSEKKEIDVLFTPTKPVPTTPDTLGLLGKLAHSTCLIEVYRNAVTPQQIKECLFKLIAVQNREINLSKKDSIERKPAFLWILTPTISQKILDSINAKTKEGWEKGVYFLADLLDTGIVAIHQLPKDRNTLWLRVLGKGKTQIKAIEEVKRLPLNYPHRDSVLELVYGLFEKLATKEKQKLIKEDEVLIMSLRQIYRDRMAEVEKIGEQRGEQRGLQQGLQLGEQRGLQQGLQLGEQRGLQQGLQLGEQRGLQRGKLETVPLLKQLGMSVEEIATRLELPIDDVIKASQN